MEEVQNPGSILNRISPSGVAWVVGIFAILVWAWHGAEIHPLQLLQDGGNIKTMAADFVPPDFSDWRDYVREMLVTIQVAVWGTLLAIICAVPLGILSASNIVPAWIYQPTRRLMDCSRAINEMIWAMLFVCAVGLGPFSGMLALWAHSTGVLAKLFSEAVESIKKQPVEGVRSTGCSFIEEVVGMVGAGGIGLVLWELIRSFDFPRTCAVLICIVVVVTIFDMLSQRLRKMVV